MNRAQRRHAAKHHRGPQPTGALVVHKGRVTLEGPVPGLGRELMKGYYVRQAKQYQVARDAARDAQEEASRG